MSKIAKGDDEEYLSPLLPSKGQGSSHNHERIQCLKAIGLQIAGITCNFIMYMMVKIATSTYDGMTSSQILTVRGYLSLLFCLIVIKSNNLDLGVIKEYRMALTARSVLGFGSNNFLNLGVSYVSLSMAMTVFNLNPLIGVFLGVVILKERANKYQIIALIFTFLGVLLLLIPCVFTFDCQDSEPFNFLLLFPLLGACCRACAMVGVRKCKDIHWIFPTFALIIPFCTISPLILYLSGEYVPFTVGNTAMLLLSASFGIASNTLQAKAFQVGEMGYTMPISYIGVAEASFTDVILFHEAIEWNQWLGALIIFLGITCVTYAKFHLNKPAGHTK